MDLRGVHRSDRQSRILFLVLSSQRTLRWVVTFIHELQWRTEFRGSRSNHFFRFGWLWSGNHRDSWLDNSRFLTGNLSERISKPFFMIKINRSNDRYIGLDRVGRIESAAEARLKNNKINFGLGKMF